MRYLFLRKEKKRCNPAIDSLIDILFLDGEKNPKRAVLSRKATSEKRKAKSEQQRHLCQFPGTYYNTRDIHLILSVLAVFDNSNEAVLGLVRERNLVLEGLETVI